MSQSSDSKIIAAVTAGGKDVPGTIPDLYRSGAHRLYAAVLNMRRMSETRRLVVNSARAR